MGSSTTPDPTRRAFIPDHKFWTVKDPKEQTGGGYLDLRCGEVKLFYPCMSGGVKSVTARGEISAPGGEAAISPDPLLTVIKPLIDKEKDHHEEEEDLGEKINAAIDGYPM